MVAICIFQLFDNNMEPKNSTLPIKLDSRFRLKVELIKLIVLDLLL